MTNIHWNFNLLQAWRKLGFSVALTCILLNTADGVQNGLNSK